MAKTLLETGLLHLGAPVVRPATWEDAAELAARLQDVDVATADLPYAELELDFDRLEPTSRLFLQASNALKDARLWMLDQPRVLAHGDLRRANVRVTAQGAQLTGWSTCRAPREWDWAFMPQLAPRPLAPGARLLATAFRLQLAARAAETRDPRLPQLLEDVEKDHIESSGTRIRRY